ncbi:N-acetylmuramoyl-L-alanine amidase [Vulcanococcus sp.]|jgi:N-acetylmuramoyl-L-alanine amidase|uniref:N-acetylmuramoyl-L-alanine amidase n=1 Tax=Vulcanococcus sp. TaxID=2856995 RepID=UPI0037D99AC3
MVRPFSDSKTTRPPVWSAAVLAGASVLALVALALHQERDPLPVSLPGVAQRPKAPAPPQQSAWVSPLSRQCGVQDQTLRQRLQALQRDLPKRIRRVSIDPSNYGERTSRDAYGNSVDTNPSLVVLHETVYGIGSAINTFTTHHPHDQDQVSYHLLVGEDGQVVETLDPSKRAFGAGYSAFKGRWDVTNPNMDGSVNNFALHLSLETPLDGEDADSAHSGYSSLQYDALAVVLAHWMRRYRIPFEHITTHRYVDLGGERADPRSFEWNALQVRLAALNALC